MLKENRAPAYGFRALIAEFLRFLGAGAVNVIFGYVVFLVLIGLISSEWLALALTYVIGLTFNYFVFSRFVFVESVGSVVRYLCSYVVAFTVNLALYSAISPWAPNPAIAQLLCLAPVAVLTYGLMRCWSFARRAGAGGHSQR